jgi:glucan 1,3-beta-glucosidase
MTYSPVSFRPRPRKNPSLLHNPIFLLTNLLSRYYQPQPDAPHSPYYATPAPFDPNFSTCLPGNCDALGIRIYNSQNVAIYGAGHYSWFANYDVSCSAYGGPRNCQSELVSIEGTTSNLWMFSMSIIGVFVDE